VKLSTGMVVSQPWLVHAVINWNSRVTFAYLILLTTVTHNAEYGNRNNNCGNNPRSDNICVVCVLWYIQVTVSIIKTSIPNVLFLSTVNFLT